MVEAPVDEAKAAVLDRVRVGLAREDRGKVDRAKADVGHAKVDAARAREDHVAAARRRASLRNHRLKVYSRLKAEATGSESNRWP